MLDLVHDGVGELIAFLRGRLHRSIQQDVVIVVYGSGDVPFPSHPSTRCLQGFGDSRCKGNIVLHEGLLNSRKGPAPRSARRRPTCKTSIQFQRNPRRLWAPDPQSVMPSIPVTRGARTLSAGTSPCAPVSTGADHGGCQPEQRSRHQPSRPCAQDAADETGFGSRSLCASLLRGASMRNHGISSCYATME